MKASVFQSCMDHDELSLAAYEADKSPPDMRSVARWDPPGRLPETGIAPPNKEELDARFRAVGLRAQTQTSIPPRKAYLFKVLTNGR